MAEIRIPRLEQGQTKIKTVPIAVTPEGFWCCPSPAVFQKTVKTQIPPDKPKPIEKTEKKPSEKTASSRIGHLDNEKRSRGSDAIVLNASLLNEKVPRPKVESVPRKVTIEFGEAGTSDLKLILLGKQGSAVKLSVHRSVLVENSAYFARKISQEQPVFPCFEIDNCDDVEIYVETIGLMYSKELKQRLMKQTVPRVLRILKVGEQLGFRACIQACLEYLEAAPWAGEEEDKVVSSVVLLEGDDRIGVEPVLKRVSSNLSNPQEGTLTHILELVLNSREEKGRREMKSVVLKLLKENNSLPSSSASSNLCSETLYTSCKRSQDSLLSLFRQVADPDFVDKAVNSREPVLKSVALEADNLLWLLDILADRRAADEVAVSWASQQELASIHSGLPVVWRHHVSTITARLFVGMGRGELLPSKDTRHLLIKTWLQPLINDYGWLRHGCRSFDREVVDEGIGRTILTLPLQEQQSVLLSWLGCFLQAGDNCPNLQRAFEVWWRRTFIRPYVEPEMAIIPKVMQEN